ncbi:hypothetical protein JNUCC1_01783 [Lentibacillus sp. JNUCC-1]|uniref:dihydropteridine reductase n=1 Tax=Lentibacillus sp. JNUCC-1 TaxID=2654513 RepID=UPI0012E75F0F|nr:dihydropteridine reductase [Lentibacillus sp. JNUCC-1]MUV37975.1 hypothetical protein [Lentibacillus sp. JNUCC-1]
MHIYWTKINKIVQEASQVRTYMLDCPEGFKWEEGAHTHFALVGFNAGDRPNRKLIRHMSISTLPYERSIGITTRLKDQCSEFKTILKDLEVGDDIAIFKTHSNVPLKRGNKNVYLLSSGVGLATFRPLVLKYLNQTADIKHIYSLNIDSSREFLFSDIFQSAPDKNFTTRFVTDRHGYYNKLKHLATDKEGLFYIVGSDEFLLQNIKVLQLAGIKSEQIILDKHASQLPEFLSDDMSV